MLATPDPLSSISVIAQDLMHIAERTDDAYLASRIFLHALLLFRVSADDASSSMKAEISMLTAWLDKAGIAYAKPDDAGFEKQHPHEIQKELIALRRIVSNHLRSDTSEHNSDQERALLVAYEKLMTEFNKPLM